MTENELENATRKRERRHFSDSGKEEKTLSKMNQVRQMHYRLLISPIFPLQEKKRENRKQQPVSVEHLLAGTDFALIHSAWSLWWAAESGVWMDSSPLPSQEHMFCALLTTLHSVPVPNSFLHQHELWGARRTGVRWHTMPILFISTPFSVHSHINIYPPNQPLLSGPKTANAHAYQSIMNRDACPPRTSRHWVHLSPKHPAQKLIL